MQVDTLIYAYLAVCCSMIIFNTVCIFIFSHREKKMTKVSKRFQKQVEAQIERIFKEKNAAPRHIRYLKKRLKRTGNLLAFDMVLEQLQRENPVHSAAYLEAIHPVFVYLAEKYQHKDEIHVTFFLYILRKYRLLHHHVRDYTDELALKLIKDRPVFAECIGPFSLAGRLVDITEAMVLCYEAPDMMHTVLEKATQFITEYVKAFKALGCHGIMIAEPLAGILSPALGKEFSCDYMKQIVDECQDKNFVIFYHNCGNNAVLQAEDIFAIGCKGYHFGDKIVLKDIMEKAPEDVIVMGNVSPSDEFFGGTRASIRKATYKVMHQCYKYDNFWLSSGCDVPALANPDNIAEFFDAANDFYKCHDMLEKLERDFDLDTLNIPPAE